MHPQEVLLTVLTFGASLIAPIYFYFRERMNRKNENKQNNYSRKRLLKLTLVILVLCILGIVMFLGLFLSVLFEIAYFTPYTVLLTVAFVVTIGIVNYGSGIYISSLIIRAFIPEKIKQNKLYEFINLAVYTFQGPISHVLIFSGAVYVLVVIAAMDLVEAFDVPTDLLDYDISLGVILAVYYSFSQMRNGSYLLQLIFGAAPSMVMVFLLIRSVTNLAYYPVASYSISFVISYFIFLVGYFVYERIRKEPFRWYHMTERS